VASADNPLPAGWRRPFVRFWRRNGWRGVALVAVVVLCGAGASIWSAIHSSNMTGRIKASSDGYTFQAPDGWNVRLTCGDQPFRMDSHAAENTCLDPHSGADAGIYLTRLGHDPTDPPPLPQFADQLVTRVAVHEPCGPAKMAPGDQHAAEACLHWLDASGTDHPGRLLVRVAGSVIMVEVCLSTDRPEISSGCDAVWTSIQLAE
jgi:hypothetical protein